MAEKEDVSASGIVLSFLVGGLTGAALAILFAPRSGKETREILSERLKDGVARGRELGDEWLAKSRAAAEGAVDFVEERRERMAAAVDAGTQAYRDSRRS
jgi:gas vesicle protein